MGEKPAVGDVADPTSLKKALRGVRAVICPTKVNPLPYPSWIVFVQVIGFVRLLLWPFDAIWLMCFLCSLCYGYFEQYVALVSVRSISEPDSCERLRTHHFHVPGIFEKKHV